MHDLELTVLIPCLNEEKTLPICIKKALGWMKENGVRGEVLVVDNGSTDRSCEVTEECGGRVVHEKHPGYGSALQAGIRNSKAEYIIMGDGDDSYDFSDLGGIWGSLKQGNQLVMGNRFSGRMQKKSMPFLHRYLGNPVLSFIGRLFFKSPIRDFHCGLRGFHRESMLSVGLVTNGMEFASEMVIKASLCGLKIAEVPIAFFKDGRDREPHLRTWRDGWRHLRFMLVYSPRWLYWWPGIILLLLGTAIWALLLPGIQRWAGVEFDIHTLAFGSLFISLGFQSILFGTMAKVFGVLSGLFPTPPRWVKWFDYIRLETGLLLGALLILAGGVLCLIPPISWMQHDYGNMDPGIYMRIIIPGMTLLLLGFQTVFGSFLLSLLSLDSGKSK